MSSLEAIVSILYLTQSALAGRLFYHIFITATVALIPAGNQVDSTAKQNEAAVSRLWQARKTLARVAASTLLSLVVTTNLLYTYDHWHARLLNQTINSFFFASLLIIRYVDINHWAEGLPAKIIVPGDKHGIGAFDPVAKIGRGLLWLIVAWTAVTIVYVWRMAGIFAERKF